MKPWLTLALSVGVLAISSSAPSFAEVPPAQQRGPATLEDRYPYRPSCRQLVPQGSDTNPAFNAWGPVIDGQHQNWYGLSSAVSVPDAYQQLDALGFCVSGGVTVPWDVELALDSGLPEDKSSLSPLERKLESAKGGNDGDFNPVAILFLGFLGYGAWVYRKEMDKAEDFTQVDPLIPCAPTSPTPAEPLPPVPSPRAFSPQVAPVAPMASPVVVESPASTPMVQSIDISAPSIEPKNPASLLAKRLRSTLITARTRVGKSMTLALSWPMVQAMGYKVWVLQPKYHPKEQHYWSGADKIFGFMIEDLQQIEDAKAREQRKEQLGQEMTKFLQDWRNQGQKILLIVDELRMIKQLLPAWYADFWTNFMIVEMSSGETADRILWAITQSSVCKDIGLSGGDRSTFDLFSIQTPDSGEHYQSLRRSFTGLPVLDRDLFAHSKSPKKAVFYHSANNNWSPMVHYSAPPNPVSAPVSDWPQTTNGIDGGVSAVSAHYTRAEVELLSRVSVSVSVELPLLMEALTALKRGESKTKIVEEVLQMKGRDFQKGGEIYEELKALSSSSEDK